MMKRWVIGCMFVLITGMLNASPVHELLERIDPGASRKFKMEVREGEKDFFELDQEGEQVVVRGNNYVSIATGINWYLKYYAHIHLSWNRMKAKLPEVLPPVLRRERHETGQKYRYYLNYCTHSYSMAFWDWERWEQEIDWMALHGVNLVLSITGMEAVWYNMLEQLGYGKKEIGEFIAGPAFLAWWHMNNLEGWGGPNPASWYKEQIRLQQRILNRLQQLGIDPVFPGYAGMLPHDAKEKLGLNVADPGMWCGYKRPAFLQPSDPAFNRIASLYYAEVERLFGKAKFFSMDPFHEGGNTKNVNLEEAGETILKAMKKANTEAVWVIQAWGKNPRPAMIENLEAGDLLVLDLWSENEPMWGDPDSPLYRETGFGKHNWLYCMLLNFGGNVGLHGRMDNVINGFYKARESRQEATLQGVGITMEGIANNPVMYELLLELPWRPERFQKEEWIKDYIKARYGKENGQLAEAWSVLIRSVYNCPLVQQGTSESLFCARPSETPESASTWGTAGLYYYPLETQKAAEKMLAVADQYKSQPNFCYDLVDVLRQAVADKGKEVWKQVMETYRKRDKAAFEKESRVFLKLILAQDSLLSVCPGFMLGNWLEEAKRKGGTEEEKQLYEWNARTQITTWGNREAADDGGLHDYSHREWAGLLKDFYYPRWKTYFENLKKRLEGKEEEEIDWYLLEEAWTRERKVYPVVPQGEVVQRAQEIYQEVFGK